MTSIVQCERCQRKQSDRVASQDDPDNPVFYLGCKSCGYPYARYVRPYAEAAT